MTNSILVATDFSPRSDRAIRRAILIARKISAELILLHAMDTDLPDQLLSIQRDANESLLADLANTIADTDQIECTYRLAFGDPFRALVDSAREIQPRIIVMGPHRRSILKDIFIGTTAERTIRESSSPIIMANGVPAADYQNILICTDFSPCSVIAAQLARQTGLLADADVTVLHVFGAPEKGMMHRTLMSGDDIEDYELAMRAQATSAMHDFLIETGLQPQRKKVELVQMSVPETIRSTVRQYRPDLLIIGTHGRSGIEKFLLGSVAEEILRMAEIDVLAVPPPASDIGGV